MRFLNSLKIPIIAVLRDSQNFVAAVDEGVGVGELPDFRAKQDVNEMAKIVSWLDRWHAPRRKLAHITAAQKSSIEETTQH